MTPEQLRNLYNQRMAQRARQQYQAYVHPQSIPQRPTQSQSGTSRVIQPMPQQPRTGGCCGRRRST